MEDCSKNFNNERCRKPKKLNHIPIIPTTDNDQNSFEFISQTSEIKNSSRPSVSPIPTSVSVGKLVDLTPTIIGKDINNSVDHFVHLNPSSKSPRETGGIRVSENISKNPHSDFRQIETLTDPENNLPEQPKGGFIFQTVEKKKPFNNPNQNVINGGSIPFISKHKPPFQKDVEDFIIQRKPIINSGKNIFNDLDVPFLPEHSPLLPEVSEAKFRFEFNEKPIINPDQGVPTAFIPGNSNDDPKEEIILQIDEKPSKSKAGNLSSFENINSPRTPVLDKVTMQPITNVFTHLSEHNFAPSPLSPDEQFHDVKIKLTKTTAESSQINSGEERRKPKVISANFLKSTTMDIPKDFSPSPKFPYPNTKGDGGHNV